ncbi:hypothetical protein SAMN02799631_05886 [Methylobacterium sp. 174MFSha1.1]|nr:hypothetical protein SAMN02799631_05886 [Methylobacterium sp. 174MFSha1.1]
MRYALAVLGLLALATFVIGTQGPPSHFGDTLVTGLLILAAVLLSAAVIVSRLDRVIELLKDRRPG